MDITSEQEPQPQPKEVVRQIREEFTLFDPSLEFTADRAITTKNPLFIMVEGYKIPMYIAARASKASKTHAFTPFHPNNGDLISARDLDLQERIKKDEEMAHIKIDSTLDPLYIDIHNRRQQLETIGLTYLNKDEIKQGHFYPAVEKTLKRLRLQLTFPPVENEDGQEEVTATKYESRIGSTSLYLGEINLARFYPTETGPLPAREYDYLSPGLNIFVPNKLEQLQQIKAKFVLVDEDKTEGTLQPEGSEKVNEAHHNIWGDN